MLEGLTSVSTLGVDDQLGNLFVSFVDLMGFLSTLAISTHGAVHKMTRFHRALDMAFNDAPSIRQFRFTDCAFLVFKDLREGMTRLMNFTSFVLALDAALIDERKHFGHLVIPRMTVSYGRTLILESELQLENVKGLNTNLVIAGPSVARAYELERSSPPFGILVAKSCISALSSSSIWTDKGVARLAVNYVKSFAQPQDKWSNSHRGNDALAFPWILLAARHSKSSRLHRPRLAKDIITRSLVLAEIIRLFWQDFRTIATASRLPSEVCRNIGMLDRMLADHLSISKGRRAKADLAKTLELN